MSSTGLFLRDGDNLIALTEQAYEAEDVLQGLLAKHPDLLPGEAMNPDEPRRFLLVRREASVAGMSLDHLFIDQDAVPTLVETKRGTNTQVRREVVSQMLDYAANAAGEWSCQGSREFPRCDHGNSPPSARAVRAGRSAAMVSRWRRMR